MATANSLLCWNNLCKTATFASSSTQAGYSVSNLQTNDHGSASMGWQSASTLTGVTITATFSSASVDAIGVFNTNFTSSATVTAVLKNGASTVYTSSSVAPVNGYGQCVWLPSSITATSCIITMTDASNPDGFLNVPQIFIGPAFRAHGSAGFSSTIGRDVTTAEVTSRGGQEYPTLFFQRRRWNLVFDALFTSEVWNGVELLNIYAAAGSNVLYVPDKGSAYIQQEALYGRLRQSADIAYPYQIADRRRWSATITERL